MRLDGVTAKRIARGGGRIATGITLAVLPLPIAFGNLSILLPVAAICIVAGAADLVRLPAASPAAHRYFLGFAGAASFGSVATVAAVWVGPLLVPGAVASLVAAHLLLAGLVRLTSDVSAAAPFRWAKAALVSLLIADGIFTAVLIALTSGYGFSPVDPLQPFTAAWSLRLGERQFVADSMAASALCIASLLSAIASVLVTLTAISQLRQWTKQDAPLRAEPVRS